MNPCKLFKTSIKDGFVLYNIVQTPDGLRCQCSQSNTIREVCSHIRLYLTKNKGVKELYLRFYMKLCKTISENIMEKNLNKILETKLKEIIDSECGFCCEKICNKEKISIENLHICKNCGGLTHNKCFRKWYGVKKSCMYCLCDEVE